MSMPAGSTVSLCQTSLAGCPAAAVRAVAMSRSQFAPGKTMTAVFIGRFAWRASGDFDPVVFDDRVGEQALAHFGDAGAGNLRIGPGQVEVDDLALADPLDRAEAHGRERVPDRLALRVEDAGPQRDVNAGVHGCSGCCWCAADNRALASSQVPARPLTGCRRISSGA